VRGGAPSGMADDSAPLENKDAAYAGLNRAKRKAAKN
jgi:hypothetical protein